MTGPDFVKARDLPVDPVDYRVMCLCRLGILRELTAEERLELAQIEAAGKAQPGPQEALQ